MITKTIYCFIACDMTTPQINCCHLANMKLKPLLYLSELEIYQKFRLMLKRPALKWDSDAEKQQIQNTGGEFEESWGEDVRKSQGHDRMSEIQARRD